MVTENVIEMNGLFQIWKRLCKLIICGESVIEEVWRKNKKLYAVFMNLEKLRENKDY